MGTSVCTDVAYQPCADSSLISHLWGAAEDWKGSHGSWVEAASATLILETFTCKQRTAVRSKETNKPFTLMNLFIQVKLKRWLVFVCQILSLFFWGMRLLLWSKCTVLDQTLQKRAIFVTQRCYVKDGVWFQRNIMWDEGTEETCWAERKEKVEVWQHVKMHTPHFASLSFSFWCGINNLTVVCERIKHIWIHDTLNGWML